VVDFRDVQSAILDPAGALTGSNAFGKVLGAFSELENMLARSDMPSATRVRTSHGAYIYASVGGQERVLGAVQGISETQQVAQKDVFEINVASEGTPNHIETGNITGRTVSCKIIELNDNLFERQLGHQVKGNKQTLLTQLPSFNLVSVDYAPSGAIKYNQIFLGCKISNFGRSRPVEGDRLVNLDVTFTWTRLLNAK